MEKNENHIGTGIGILLIILFVTVLSLGGYIVYDKLIKDNDNNDVVQNNPVDNCSCEEKEEIRDIVGYYYSKYEKEIDGSTYVGESKLIISEDNTYTISNKHYGGAGYGSVGTYKYDNNKIIFYQKWSFGSDAELKRSIREIQLIFNDDGSITHKNGFEEGIDIVYKKEEKLEEIKDPFVGRIYCPSEFKNRCF